VGRDVCRLLWQSFRSLAKNTLDDRILNARMTLRWLFLVWHWGGAYFQDNTAGIIFRIVRGSGVILSAAKNLETLCLHHPLRSFAKNAQDDRVLDSQDKNSVSLDKTEIIKNADIGKPSCSGGRLFVLDVNNIIFFLPLWGFYYNITV
jgi:hypothetical protein